MLEPVTISQGKLVLVTLFAAALLSPTVTRSSTGSRSTIDFNRDIRPILSDHCYRCHGPDAHQRKADLRLDLRDGLYRTQDGVTPVAPGHPETSEIVRRILCADPEDRMPPPKSKIRLSEGEKQEIVGWIKEGAPFELHWSFKPLSNLPVPRVKDSRRVRNPIDAFVQRRLEEEGFTIAPEAARERLLRRLTFDLTGLPPTLHAIDAFVADPSPDAYETAVDRLLDRPAYGERLAAEWLDVARYSDTYGYQVDRDRFVWPWRDWVIDAFNRNLPFDQFIRWQLAGDLLPHASDEQILATTFNRLHPQKVEGGSVPEEFRVEYVTDRTQTFATAFLGLTLQCAKCHDHKYDPISQKEFYQLSAFFANIDEAGLYSYFTPAVPTPTLRLSTPVQKAQISRFEARIADQEAKIVSSISARQKAFLHWLSTRPPIAPVEGPICRFTFDAVAGGKIPNSVDPKSPATTPDANRLVAGKFGKAIWLTGDDEVKLPVGNFKRYEPFSVSLWMQTPDVKERAVVFHRSRAWTDAASRGYQLLIEKGKLSASLIHFWPGNAIRVRTLESLPPRQWTHVVMTYDGSSRARGLKLYLNGEHAETKVVRDHLYKKITGGGGDHITIGARFRDRGFHNGLVDEFQVFARELSPLEIAQLHDGTSLTALLKKPASSLSKRERDRLRDFYFDTQDPIARRQRAALQVIRKDLFTLVDGIREIMVMREMTHARPAYLLKRGAYNARGEEVHAGTPRVLPPFPKDAPRNRLGLAQWLTSPNHPLTARVTVNRYWQMLFGRGLVPTPEDFGSQGKPPTHPELLNWLAKDFIDHGWDLKRLIRLMVTSSVYRQTSNASPKLLAKDPRNQWLGRAPRYRLSAEMIRDNALAVSGLMVSRIGGPPARPYEVTASFRPVKKDTGSGLYRRSLYTYWKRTAPAPAMMTLDAAKRDVCAVRRETTSTPLQAFIFMNDPQFVEAGRVLAEKVLRDLGPGAKADQIDRRLFRLLTSRRPRARERKILARLFEDQRTLFQQDPARSRAFLAAGEAAQPADPPLAKLAATAVVATALMSYDECVMKR